MEIKKLTAEQVGPVLELWCSNWMENGESSPTLEDRERIRRVLEGYTSNPQVCCFVAEQEHRSMGFVTASLSSHPVMEGLVGNIEELYVLPEYRRQSIGSQLAQAAVSFLDQHGAGVLRTHICGDSEAGKAFWRALGWEADLATFSRYDVRAYS